MLLNWKMSFFSICSDMLDQERPVTCGGVLSTSLLNYNYLMISGWFWFTSNVNITKPLYIYFFPFSSLYYYAVMLKSWNTNQVGLFFFLPFLCFLLSLSLTHTPLLPLHFSHLSRAPPCFLSHLLYITFIYLFILAVFSLAPPFYYFPLS